MSQKIEITKKILEIIYPEFSEKHFKNCVQTWWTNPRQKEKGGLQLTAEGYEAFIKADIKPYRIGFTESPQYTSQLILQLDQLVDTPFYLGKKEVVVFDERMAVQLVLFSGNIFHFTSVKAKSASR